MLFIKLNIQRFADGKIVLETVVDTTGVEEGIEDIKDEVTNEEVLDFKTSKQSKGMKSILQLTKKIGKGFLGISASVAKFLGGIVKVVAKLGLIGGLIGVVALIGLGIANAFKEAIAKDEELKTKLEYLKFAFTTAFLGIGEALVKAVKWVINAILTFLGYIGRFIYLLTGKNIFKKSGIDDFQKSLNKSSKDAKELNKQLAGFDEMNVLSDSASSATAGGVNTKIDVPDLSKFVEQETAMEKGIKKMIDKWFKLGEEMKNALDNPELFKSAYGRWAEFIYGVTHMFYGLWEVIEGAIEIVGGVLDVIVGIFTLNGQKILDGLETVGRGFVKILEGLGRILVGAIQTLVGLFLGISETVGRVFVSICEFIGKSFVNILAYIGNLFVSAWDKIKNGAVNAFNGIVNVFSKFGDFFYNIFSNAWKRVKTLFSQGGQLFVGIKDGIVNAFKAIVNGLINGINKVIAIPFEKINKLLNKIRKIEILGVKPFKSLWDKDPLPVPKIPKLARGGIVNNPGKGVMMGNYLAGEGQNPEAVLPLDNTTMDRLGEAIARHMNITNDNKIYMNARQIARQMNITNAEQNFAGNR